MDLLADLDARGLIHGTTDREGLADRLDEGPIAVYVGFDPTADSLHVGNLVGLMTLRRFQDAGHRPIVLAGGATGMVGDPSGRSTERNMLDDDGLAANLAGIVPQLRQFLDFDRDVNPAKLLDNRAWTVSMSILDFLRDVGKHVTVNTMMGKESVRARITGSEGLSFTEFSYMLLQAHDFLWLFEHEGCEMQMGGSDQWGNISLGLDLIRRRTGGAGHGLTWPLLTRTDGTKYGKTAGGETMWLSPVRLSPYQFFQAWMQSPDEDVERLLLQLTLLPVSECVDIAIAHAADPERREGQRRLASEVTALVHGPTAATGAAEATELLFSPTADPASASAHAFDAMAGELPTTSVVDDERGLLDLLSDTDLVRSRSDARRAITEGGIYVNNQRVDDVDAVIDAGSRLAGGYVLLRRGKKRYHLLRFER